jgi:cytochrome c biogenesis protein CcmG/thiol:disulfide interchange protein DsbE
VRTAIVVLAAAALIAAVAIGLSQAGSQGGEPKRGGAPTGAAAAAALNGAPAPLASLYRQPSRLLVGGKAAFDRRRASLAGYPAVVNGWASWCGPCRFEFPFFQAAAVRSGKRVGFLGIDVTDNPGDAERFLERFPLPYPSYTDPRGTLMQSLVPSAGLPNTVFFDRRGRKAFVHQGGYSSQASLDTDIRRYAR